MVVNVAHKEDLRELCIVYVWFGVSVAHNGLQNVQKFLDSRSIWIWYCGLFGFDQKAMYICG